MHRLTQELVKRLMPPDEHDERQHDALTALAAYAPPDAEEDAEEYNATYAELQKHLIPSGALDSDDPAVRRWVVNQIRYLYRRRHAEMWQTAGRLAERALSSSPRGIASYDDALRLRLTVQLANIYRALGRYHEARGLDEEVLHQQRRTLTQLHPRTLMTARSHGGDLRGLGLFDEALAEDQSTLDGLRAVLGDDHAATLTAFNNLAFSWLLAGDAGAALENEQQVFESRLRLLGEDDQATWRARGNVGGFMRELGRYEESRWALQDALERLRMLSAGTTEVMRVEKSIGVTFRRLGRIPEAEQHTESALRLYVETHGEGHPDTLSCALSRAANLHAAGLSSMAAGEAARCLDRYIEHFGKDHPFSHSCRSNLGIYVRASGDPMHSLELTRTGLAGLQDQLLSWHPWVLAASVNHATSLVAAGDLEAARSLDQSTYAECQESLGADHPCTEAARVNAADSRRRAAGDLDSSGRRNMDIDIPHT
jgi:tetratricopeptide (TPR) repeat protein